MTVKPNGTHAKEIALHFVKLTDTRVTPHIMGKTIVQAKNILDAGYTKEEILEVMEYVILKKNFNVYSLGYFSACINDVLRDIQREKAEEEARIAKEKLEEEMKSAQSQGNEVMADDDSTERNREKARRLGVQSGLRKKFNFDMFEGQ